jgi:hypothetical protein
MESVIASLRLSVEYRMSLQQLVLPNDIIILERGFENE